MGEKHLAQLVGEGACQPGIFTKYRLGCELSHVWIIYGLSYTHASTVHAYTYARIHTQQLHVFVTREDLKWRRIPDRVRNLPQLLAFLWQCTNNALS